jgi:hypothetical protein
LGMDSNEKTMAMLRRRHSRVIRRVLARWGVSARGGSESANSERYPVALAWMRARARG